ncbi:MAG: hypothetical protein KF681_01310 [Bdellovibrionaceae bacterium]|nr:hypothetical protein [Pseudobdellovibrionaceae bacterium]
MKREEPRTSVKNDQTKNPKIQTPKVETSVTPPTQEDLRGPQHDAGQNNPPAR